MSLHCDMEVLFETLFRSSKKRRKRDEEDFEDLIEEIGETEELEDEEDDELMSSTLIPAEMVSKFQAPTMSSFCFSLLF